MELRQSLKILTALTGTYFLVACGRGEGPHQPIPRSASPQSQISFSGQILPLVQVRCARCHNSGTNDWTREENLRRVAASGALRQRIAGGTMPQVGSPESLAITPAERATILAWAQSTGQLPGPSPSGPPGPDDIHDRKLAVVLRCASCHGLQGLSESPETPNLASHSKSYLTDRLTEFLLPEQPGSMPSTLRAILREHALPYTLKDAQTVVPSPELAEVLAYVAEFFSNQHVLPMADEFVQQQKTFSGEQKALFADGKKIVSDQCVVCHLQADFLPADSMPMIFAQKANYLRERFQQFRRGEGGVVMPAVAAGLSDENIKALVFFLSHVHPTQVTPNS